MKRQLCLWSCFGFPLLYRPENVANVHKVIFLHRHRSWKRLLNKVVAKWGLCLPHSTLSSGPTGFGNLLDNQDLGIKRKWYFGPSWFLSSFQDHWLWYFSGLSERFENKRHCFAVFLFLIFRYIQCHKTAVSRWMFTWNHGAHQETWTWMPSASWWHSNLFLYNISR